MEHRQIDFVIQFEFENGIIYTFCLCYTTDGTFLRNHYPSRRCTSLQALGPCHCQVREKKTGEGIRENHLLKLGLEIESFDVTTINQSIEQIDRLTSQLIGQVYHS